MSVRGWRVTAFVHLARQNRFPFHVSSTRSCAHVPLWDGINKQIQSSIRRERLYEASLLLSDFPPGQLIDETLRQYFHACAHHPCYSQFASSVFHTLQDAGHAFGPFSLDALLRLYARTDPSTFQALAKSLSIDQSPTNQKQLHLTILVLCQQGHVPEAIELFLRFEQQSDMEALPRTYRTLFHACATHQSAWEAMRLFDYLQESGREMEWSDYLHLLKTLTQAERNQEAVDYYRLFIEQGRSCPDVSLYNEAMLAFIRLEQFTEAMEVYEKMQNDSHAPPPSHRTHQLVSICSRESRNPQLALESLRRAIDSAQVQPQQISKICQNAVLTCESEEDLEAMRDFLTSRHSTRFAFEAMNSMLLFRAITLGLLDCAARLYGTLQSRLLQENEALAALLQLCAKQGNQQIFRNLVHSRSQGDWSDRELFEPAFSYALDLQDSQLAHELLTMYDSHTEQTDNFLIHRCYYRLLDHLGTSGIYERSQKQSILHDENLPLLQQEILDCLVSFAKTPTHHQMLLQSLVERLKSSASFLDVSLVSTLHSMLLNFPEGVVTLLDVIQSKGIRLSLTECEQLNSVASTLSQEESSHRDASARILELYQKSKKTTSNPLLAALSRTPSTPQRDLELIRTGLDENNLEQVEQLLKRARLTMTSLVDIFQVFVSHDEQHSKTFSPWLVRYLLTHDEDNALAFYHHLRDCNRRLDNQSFLSLLTHLVYSSKSRNLSPLCAEALELNIDLPPYLFYPLTVNTVKYHEYDLTLKLFAQLEKRGLKPTFDMHQLLLDSVVTHNDDEGDSISLDLIHKLNNCTPS